MPRIVSRFSLACVSLIFVTGCGPEVSNAELGRRVWEIPQVPGAETPYVLPEAAKSPVPDPYELEMKKRREKAAVMPLSKTKSIPAIDPGSAGKK